MKTLLFFLLSFIGVTSTLSGLLMIFNPYGDMLNLSLSLLKDTPFKDFRIPGILLAGLVGSTNLLAVFYNLQRHPNRYNWAIAGGVMIIGWIIAQMILIRTLHWLHFVYLILGLLIILTSFQQKGKWAV